MSTPTQLRRLIIRPYVGVLLIVLAVGIWSVVLWQHAHHTPAMQHIEAGRQALSHGDGLAAEHEWREAVRLEPRNGEAWELLGDYYLTAQDWAMARTALTEVERLQPQTPHLYARLATCAAHIDDIPATQRYVDEELKRDPDSTDALELQATLLARAHESEKRLNVLRRLVKLEPDNANALARLGDALTVQRQYQEARPVLEHLLKIEPGFGPAYAMRGEGYFNSDPSPAGLTLAVEDLTTALRLVPQDQLTRLLLAKVYLRQGQPARAIPLLETIARVYPPPADLSYLFELANAYQQAGNRAKASALRVQYAMLEQRQHRQQVLTSRLANTPDNFEDNFQLGMSLLQSENPLNADKYLSKALTLRPADARVKAANQQLEHLYTMDLQAARLALRDGNYQKASRRISHAMLLRPHDARTAQAVQMIQRAVTQAPAHAAPPATRVQPERTP